MNHNTKNFKVKEFACKCGCGFDSVDQKVIDMCQKIRDKLGVPVKINSGCRCAKHNQKVGGVKNSQHTLGLAADIACSLGAKKIVQAIKELHAGGELEELRYCKEYTSWVHVDCGKVRKNIFDVRD